MKHIIYSNRIELKDWLCNYCLIYVKSDICYAGFRWDRQWLVVNSKGRAYTQRVEPKLALVGVELPKDAFSEDWKPNPNSFMGRYSLTLAAPFFVFFSSFASEMLELLTV